MTFKKVMSALMAGAMVLTMGMSAMASDETSKADLAAVEIPVTSTVNVPTLKIMIPNSIGMVVNPYRLEANVGTNDAPILKNGQVVSKTYFIKNYSPVGIKVTPTVSGGAAFTLLPSGAPATTPTDGYLEKQGIINFEYETATDGNEPTWPASVTKKLVLGEEPATPSAAPILNVGREGTDSDPAINFDNSLAFRFTGTVTETPTDPWTAEDVVEAALVFEFASQPNVNGTLALDGSSTAEIAPAATTTLSKPTDATADKIFWSSSDKAVATVAAADDGDATNPTLTGGAKVTGVADGTATITATYQDNTGKVHIDSIVITVATASP